MNVGGGKTSCVKLDAEDYYAVMDPGIDLVMGAKVMQEYPDGFDIIADPWYNLVRRYPVLIDKAA